MNIRINTNLSPDERQQLEEWVDGLDAPTIDTVKVDETPVTIRGPLASVLKSEVTYTEPRDHGLLEALDKAVATVRQAQQHA